ncbi:MAG TPA: hypothetical protein VK250_11225 [Nitrososphaeraceae archaeon]|nr:hypothetical protein [Nitrososphaeraceae archaeon]
MSTDRILFVGLQFFPFFSSPVVCATQTIKKMNHLPKTLGHDLARERLVLSGKVLDVLCEPVEDVVLDFWQADSGRDYDNLGYTLR